MCALVLLVITIFALNDVSSSSPHLFAYGRKSSVDCQLSCNSCPEPLVLSSEEVRLLEDVAKYGEAQRVEVRGEMRSLCAWIMNLHEV